MPIDALFVKYLSKELDENLKGSSIKKIYNISNNEFVIKFHTKKNLYINVGNECRINITTKEFTYPEKPANFTMLLRKYLNNFKVCSIENYKKDRIIKFHLDGLDEIKDHTARFLYIELFGRYSNIILTDSNNVIINALKLVNNDNRTVLANYNYTVCQKDEYQSTKDIEKLYSENPLLFENVKPSSTDKDLYYADIFDNAKYYDSISNLLDNYYIEQDQKRRVNFLTGQCQKNITTELKKLKRKEKKLEADYSNNSNYTIYKTYGDLILTYGYQNKNDEMLICKDFNNNQQEIKLNAKLSVSDNAKLYYNKYSKYKRSLDFIIEQMNNTCNRIEYLNNLLFQLSIGNEKEITEIYQEFNNKPRKPKQQKSKIHELVFEDYKILVGKNNIQNEEITFKLSRKNDIWFHVKDVPGSHVLLKYENLDNEMILHAARIAAYYSKAKTYPKVEVIYSDVKNVKKISGSYPGHVSIINDINHVIVEPNKE